MNKSKIDWCDMTWNPVTGCLHNCKYCYAARIANRFSGCDIHKPNSHNIEIIDGKDYLKNTVAIELYEPLTKNGKIAPYPIGFKPTFHRYRLNEPKQKTKGRKIFVCSMADLFGEWVPDTWIEEVLKTCESTPQHTYMFLTKNPKRYGQLNSKNHLYNWDFAKDNMWLGITVTKQDDLNRLKHLPYGNTNTFISVEPMQSEIDLSWYIPQKDTTYKCSYCGYHANYFSHHCQYCGKEGGYSGSFRKQPINWIIVGAQTGPGAISPKKEWVQSIIDQSKKAGIPIFLKDNLNWDKKNQEYPESMGVWL
jgi:protein gp37